MIEKRFILHEEHLNKMINDACASADIEMKSYSECFEILTDVERFKKDPPKAMDLIFLAQIGSFFSPNYGWVRSAAKK